MSKNYSHAEVSIQEIKLEKNGSSRVEESRYGRSKRETKEAISGFNKER